MLGFRRFPMTITNKNDANKAAVLSALSSVQSALKNAPQTAEVARALAQCQRLELAIRQFHAEGLRFAAYTLLHMVLSHGTGFTEPVQIATRELKTALETAGYPH
jgi:hypothetical protein